MDVYDSEVDEAIVLSDKGVTLSRISLKDKGTFRQMPIGFLVSYKEEHEYTLIVFLKEGKFKLRVFCNNKCIMRNETEFIFDTVQRVLSINPWFYGKGYVYCEVCDSAGESVYKSDALVNDSNFFVPNLKSYEEYTICFFEKGKGLTLKKNREMRSFKRVFYARADFVGKEFRISEVSYRESDMMHQRYVLEKTYIRFQQENSDGTYVAEIYWKDNNTNYRSNIIKPVRAEVCSEVINGKMELLVTKDGKLLTIDTSRNHVADSVYCKGNEVIEYTVTI